MTTRRDRDVLHRFVFEDTNVRGVLVHLDASWQAVLERRTYPDPVRTLLGQAMAAVVLLSTTVKYQGSVTLQLRGRGPVTLLVVQVRPGRHVRGIAHWRDPVHTGTLAEVVGEAQLAITIDPGEGMDRYQGIVETGAARTLAQALEGYFERSEQLPTRLWLAADGVRAAGMLLQQLPGAGRDADAWNRLEHLGATLTPGELLQLTDRELLHRLFHEERVRLFEADPVSFRCDCSRERTDALLRGLGIDEVRTLLAEQGRVHVECEFCGHAYDYDAVDVEQLFAAEGQPDVPRTRH
ncbi:MAG: Hsp33 family molecular chaperone HslO [Gammaproteobacteria bacterium]|nr:MAG: Hsp33 family molecular chaperone HslO [Gammaproteobacteria bacterium]